MEQLKNLRTRSSLGQIYDDLGFREIPARKLDRYFRSHLPAQWEDAGDKWYFANQQAVDEIFTPAVDGIGHRDRVLPIFGYFVQKYRVGVEPPIVGKGHFFPAGSWSESTA